MPNARSIAVDLLDRVQTGTHTLDHLLLKADSHIQSLQRADRAFVHALVFGVLRWQARLDWIIAQLTARPEKKIDPLVNVILRLGLFQILFLDRVPNSAAVNTAVELAKTHRRKWATGFVNSVLRRAITRSGDTAWPDRREDPIAYLSAYHSYPGWLISRWIDRWGQEETESLCEKVNAVPNITLRTNTLRATRRELSERIVNEADDVKPTRHCPEGLSFYSPRRPITQWPTFQKGWFQIQNEAAQCIGHLLSPAPGQRVWDVCAGLGTKTAHLAQLMKNSGHLLATDLYAGKLERLQFDMQRLGVQIVETMPMDLTQSDADRITGQYDRILLDAPCTGLGVLQRNPDGKWRTPSDAIHTNSRRQMMLMENVAPHVKPDGVLVYAVCSFEPEENEGVVHGFLQKHPEFVIDHPRLDEVENHDKLLTSEGFLKTFPHRHQMDGFFAAALRKRG